MSSRADELVDLFKNLTLTELTEFRQKFEDTFDVTAEAPAAVIVPTVVEEVVEEQTEFDVILEAAGEKRIDVIKAVRELGKLGLKEAKDAVESVPKLLTSGIDKRGAEAMRDKLVAVGATVSIK